MIKQLSRSLARFPTLFTLSLPSDCSLGSVICSYGFSYLQPNLWIKPSTTLSSISLLEQKEIINTFTFEPEPLCLRHGGFIRSFRFGEQEQYAVYLLITQESKEEEKEMEDEYNCNTQFSTTTRHQYLTYHASQHLVVRALSKVLSCVQPPHDVMNNTSYLNQLKQCIQRMLRFDSSLEPSDEEEQRIPHPYASFYKLVPSAQSKGFSRLFRSPTLYEDCMKTITVCNIQWSGTRSLNQRLCTDIGLGKIYQLEVVLSPPPYASSPTMIGIFPSPWEVSETTDEFLREVCRVGYRSQRILLLSQRFIQEKLGEQIENLIVAKKETKEIFKFLLKIHGFGPFAAYNVLGTLGRFDVHPFDSETVRHMREFHGIDKQRKKSAKELMDLAKQHYSVERYGQWIFLVYWFELWVQYQLKNPTLLDPSETVAATTESATTVASTKTPRKRKPKVTQQKLTSESEHAPSHEVEVINSSEQQPKIRKNRERTSVKKETTIIMEHTTEVQTSALFSTPSPATNFAIASNREIRAQRRAVSALTKRNLNESSVKWDSGKGIDITSKRKLDIDLQ